MTRHAPSFTLDTMAIQRLRHEREKLEGLAARGRGRLEQERERRFAVALAFAFADRGRQAAASVLAGALAFRLFLTALPLTLVLVVGLGYLKSSGGSPQDALKQAGIKGALASTISSSSDFSNPGRTIVLLLGLAGLFAGARTSVATLRAIHALAWHLPVVRWRRGGRAAMVFLGAAAVLVACAGLATRARTEAGVGLSLGASALLALVAAAIWLGASLMLPHGDGIGWSELVPGALLVGIGFALLEAVTTNWIGPKLQKQSELYGSLAVSFVVLGWLYVIGRLMVAAPLLNAALVERRNARGPVRQEVPPAPRMDRDPSDGKRA
jgi:membrane protein